jgi:hypothetical protein
MVLTILPMRWDILPVEVDLADWQFAAMALINARVTGF